jgi:hypothetical protein
MVVGVGYRMLPMVLPAAMPRGAPALAGAIVTEAGVLGLAGSLLLAKPKAPAFALLTALGLGLFLSRVVFMLRNRRPAPADRPRADWPLAHVLQAVAYLAISVVLGVLLILAPASETSLRLAFAYGVCGLLGFLCQLVIGIEARIVPLAAWIRGYADGGFRTLPPSAHAAAHHAGGWLPLVLWSFGVPCLAAGLGFERPAYTSLGAGALAAAVAFVAAMGARALARLRAPAQPPP